MPYLINGVKCYNRNEVAVIVGFHNGTTLAATLAQIPKRNYDTTFSFPVHDRKVGSSKYWKVERKDKLLAWRDWYNGVKRLPGNGTYIEE